MRTRSVAIAAALWFLALAVGCGGTEGGTLVTAGTSPGGIWEGTDSGSGGGAVTGIVDEKGHFVFILPGQVQYVGTLASSNDSVSGSFDGVADFGTPFGDGSTHGTGTLTGVLAERSTLKITYQFTTDLGTAGSGTMTLSYNALYNVASSFSMVAGNYTDVATGDTVSISGSGAITSQDATSSCVVNGQVSLINTSYNAYSVSYSYASCTGTSAVLNGLQFTGLATLNNGGSPLEFIVAVTGGSGSNRIGLVLTLDHQ